MRNILIIIGLLIVFITNGQENKKRYFDFYYSNNLSLSSNRPSEFKNGYGYSFGFDYRISFASKLNLVTGISLFNHATKYTLFIDTDSELGNNDYPVYYYQYKCKDQNQYIAIPFGIDYNPVQNIQISCGLLPNYFYRSVGKAEIKEIYGNLATTNKKEIENHDFDVDYLHLGFFASFGYIFKINSFFEIPISINYTIFSKSTYKSNLFKPDYPSMIGLKISIRYKW